jgi:ADP-heptose:LPS heptosyltransferase
LEARPGVPYQRVLLILLVPIGDTLFATPAIRALRRAYPAVLENNPDIDDLLVHPDGIDCWRTPAFFARLRSKGYDLAVHFAPFHDYYGAAAGIQSRLTLPVPWLFWLLPHRNRRWRFMHARDHYLDTLKPLGLSTADRKPVLKISGRQEAFAEAYLAERGHVPGELLVGIHAGAAGFRGAKRWSPAGFAHVARELGQKRHVRLVFFGSTADRALSRAVVDAGVPDGYIDTCGHVSLSQAIGLLSRLDLLIGNDSGPLHLAAAVGVPVIGLYGPTRLMNFHPLGEHVRAVTGAVPCPANYGFIGNRSIWSWRACKGECLDSIKPADVLDAARDLLPGCCSRMPAPAL